MVLAVEMVDIKSDFEQPPRFCTVLGIIVQELTKKVHFATIEKQRDCNYIVIQIICILLS